MITRQLQRDQVNVWVCKCVFLAKACSPIQDDMMSNSSLNQALEENAGVNIKKQNKTTLIVSAY